MELDVSFVEEAAGPDSRSKSPLGLRYAAEVKLFRAQHGGLEEIRNKLGYSRRKMCQLLLVDPSAWTRWMRDETKVPAHIYRALEWYLALNQKALTHPELADVFIRRHRLPEKQQTDDGLKEKITLLEACLKAQQTISWLLTGAGFAMALSLSYLFVR